MSLKKLQESLTQNYTLDVAATYRRNAHNVLYSPFRPLPTSAF